MALGLLKNQKRTDADDWTISVNFSCFHILERLQFFRRRLVMFLELFHAPIDGSVRRAD